MDRAQHRRRGLAAGADRAARHPRGASSCGSRRGTEPRRSSVARGPSPSGSSRCPTASLLYVDDGDGRRRAGPRPRARARERRSCAGRPSRTCSSTSPAARSSTDARPPPPWQHPASGQSRCASPPTSPPLYKRTWRGTARRQRSSTRSSSCWRWASASARSWTAAGPGRGFDGVSYLAFVAPGTARARRRCRRGAVEAAWPVLGNIKYTAALLRDAHDAARRRPRSSCGQLLWIGVRLARRCRGLPPGHDRASARPTRSWGCSRCPAGVLTGLAFAASADGVRRAPSTARAPSSPCSGSGSSRCSSSPARSSRSPSCRCSLRALAYAIAALARRRPVPPVDPRRPSGGASWRPTRLPRGAGGRWARSAAGRLWSGGW